MNYSTRSFSIPVFCKNLMRSVQLLPNLGCCCYHSACRSASFHDTKFTPRTPRDARRRKCATRCSTSIIQAPAFIFPCSWIVLVFCKAQILHAPKNWIYLLFHFNSSCNLKSSLVLSSIFIRNFIKSQELQRIRPLPQEDQILECFSMHPQLRQSFYGLCARTYSICTACAQVSFTSASLFHQPQIFFGATHTNTPPESTSNGGGLVPCQCRRCNQRGRRLILGYPEQKHLVIPSPLIIHFPSNGDPLSTLTRSIPPRGGYVIFGVITAEDSSCVYRPLDKENVSFLLLPIYFRAPVLNSTVFQNNTGVGFVFGRNRLHLST